MYRKLAIHKVISAHLSYLKAGFGQFRNLKALPDQEKKKERRKNNAINTQVQWKCQGAFLFSIVEIICGNPNVRHTRGLQHLCLLLGLCRVKDPSDLRGVLQVSPTNGLVQDQNTVAAPRYLICNTFFKPYSVFAVCPPPPPKRGLSGSSSVVDPTRSSYRPACLFGPYWI